MGAIRYSCLKQPIPIYVLLPKESFKKALSEKVFSLENIYVFMTATQ